MTRELVAAARAIGVRDRRVLAAIRNVRRELFVPADCVEQAGWDIPLPIPHGQVTTQPSLIAVMVEALGLTDASSVLEVGTGLGYEAAVLGRLARHVWTIEWWPDLVDAARANLATAGVTNVSVVTGDGGAGLPGHAPYDGVVVAAAAPAVPLPLVDQLADGGHLVQPIGVGGAEDVTLFVKRHHTLQKVRSVIPARFVPLVGGHGSH